MQMQFNQKLGQDHTASKRQEQDANPESRSTGIQPSSQAGFTPTEHRRGGGGGHQVHTGKMGGGSRENSSAPGSKQICLNTGQHCRTLGVGD